MVTMQLEYPRFILAEVNTHRMLSKNSFSSRATPFNRMVEIIRENMVRPVAFGSNKPGMQAGEEVKDVGSAEAHWFQAMEAAISFATQLFNLGVHKQVVNRITEPWHMMRTVMSGTEWNNMLWLRCHPDAQPEFQELAKQIAKCLDASVPMEINPGEWHLPYVHRHRTPSGKLVYLDDGGYELDLQTAKEISASCCAQVSYRRLDTSATKAKDIHDRLIGSIPKHMSPTEHQATPMSIPMWKLRNIAKDLIERDSPLFEGNLKGWVQYRKEIEDENLTEPFIVHD